MTPVSPLHFCSIRRSSACKMAFVTRIPQLLLLQQLSYWSFKYRVVCVNSSVQVDSQMLDPSDLKWSRFVSTNGRVADAAAELEEEELVRPWSPEEKRIFNDKFLLYPKVGYCPRRFCCYHTRSLSTRHEVERPVLCCCCGSL